MKIIKDLDKKAIANFDIGNQMKFFRKKTPPEKLVSSAKKNLSQFHFVGLAEKFQESLLLLCYTFGWRPIRDNWKLNVSPPRAHKNDLTTNQLNKVKDAISLDLKLYEFGKELFESRFSQMVHELEEKYFEEKYSKIPSNEKIHQMLEKHYADRFNKSIEQQVSSVDYDFNQGLSGSGWYWREVLEETGQVFRWTGPENVSTIDFPLASDEDLVIHLQLLRGVTRDVLDSMSLKVNDTPIDIKILYSKPDKTVFEGFIPKTALQTNNKFTRLTFEVNQTINPHKQDPKDPTDRSLGVAFDRIRIFS